MNKAQSLAELVLMNETKQARAAVGDQRSYHYDFTRSLDDIAEYFTSTTPLGLVVAKEGLTVKAIHTYQSTDSAQGWSGLEITLHQGISHYIEMTRFYESGHQGEIFHVSVDKWPDLYSEADTLLQWLSRARKMLQDNVWLPKGESQ